MERKLIGYLLLVALLIATAGGASAQVFGQNKVQYKDLDWAVIETDNFEVYFYAGEREAAMDAARMAERAYARISAILRHDIPTKVPLILYASHSDFQSSNVSPGFVSEGTGGYTEFLKRRVSIPFTGGYGDLDHVLTHELVHAFQIDLLFGRSDRGLANPFGAYTPPLWFMEGMAEYLSVTEVDELTEMWLRDAALQGYLTPLNILSRVGDIRVYRFGQSIFAYIGKTFGDERIGELLKRVARTRSVNIAFQDVLGMTLEKLSEDWMEEVRKTYLPQIRDHEKPIEFARRLTDAGDDLSSFHLAPAISSDGSQMVYLSDRSLYIDLYLASALDGKVQRRLVKGSRAEEFESLRFLSASLDFSPNDERLAFASKSGGSDAIYLIDVDDGKVAERIEFGLDGMSHPSFSPDGEWIVFVGLNGGRSNLYRCRTNGKDFEQLTDNRYLASAPKFSPDGKSIAFITDESDETDFADLIFAKPTVALFDLESRTVEVLTNMQGANSAPHFFPDGRHILYVSDRSGISNIFVRDLDTGCDAQLTDILTGVTGVIPLAPAVSLSRDGRRVIFSAFSRGEWDLFAIKDPLDRAEFEEPPPTEPPESDDLIAGIDTALDADEEVTSETERYDSSDQLFASSITSFSEAVASVDSLGVFWPLAEGPADTLPRIRASSMSPGGPESPPPPLRIGQVFDLHRQLPDTTAFNVDRYRIRFSIDFAAANGFFASNTGLAAQTVLYFSDVLGNHSLVVGANVYGSIAESDLLFEYVNLSKRINYGIALFQLRDDFFLTTAEDTDEFVSQIYRGFDLTLSRPFNRFRRLELGIEALQVDEKVYQEAFGGSNIYFSDPTEENNLYFVRPGLAIVADNAIYGYTGPIGGGRSRYGVDVSLGDLQSSRWVLDRRSYWNLRQRYAFAMRLVGATSQGKDPQVFRIGGPYTIRGFDYGEFAGHNVGLLNLEFRFPLIEVLQLGWPLPLGLQGVRGAVFFDAGAAWRENDKFRAFRSHATGWRLEDINASFGLSSAINIGFAILRFELAQPTNLGNNIGDLRRTFSIGSDF